MNIWWPFTKKTQVSEELRDDRSIILRKLDASDLPRDTLVKVRAMINSGDIETVSLTESIIKKNNGLPSLKVLIDKHKFIGVRNSKLQKLNHTLKLRRGN